MRNHKTCLKRRYRRNWHGREGLQIDFVREPGYNKAIKNTATRYEESSMQKKMTMQDIADTCGVAKSTISRYINGGYVKEETKAIIKKVIEENHYQPNAFAQSLKAKKSKLIGVIAPCLDSTVSSRIMMAIDAYLRKEGYTSLIINTNHEVALELENMENLWNMKVDGIILLATQMSDQHKRLIKRMEIPVVVVGQVYEEGISIVNDDFAAGKMVGRYALETGHKNIWYLGVAEQDEAVGKNRKQGVLEGCYADDVNLHEFVSDFSFQHGYEVTKTQLVHDTPDMIICATDTMALGAFKALQEVALQVPNEVSLIGFGGYEISSLITPKLTTISFDNSVAGYLAAETLLKMIGEKPVSKRQIIEYTFVKGASVSHK